MYILNKKTGVWSECSNLDIIKYCKKNAEEFTVSEEMEDSQQGNNGETVKEKPLNKMKVDELKALALEKEIDVEGLSREEMLKVIKNVLNGSD